MKNWFVANRRFLLRALGTLLSVGLVIVLVHEGGWDEIVTAFQQLTLTQILLGLALMLVSRVFVAARWYVLLRSGGVKISFRDATALTFTGMFASNFLPTTIGGDVVRLAGAMQAGFDRAICLASLVADRLVGAFGMLFTVPFGIIPAWNVLAQHSMGLAAASAFVTRLVNFIKRTLRSFSIWWSQPLEIFKAFCFTWGNMLLMFWIIYILIEGLGSHVNFWLVAGVWSLSYFVTLIPISINGYGVQELSLTFLLSKVAGLEPAHSLTVAILFRAFLLLASLPGAVYLPSVLAAMKVEKGNLEEPSNRR